MTTIKWNHSKTDMPFFEIGQVNNLRWWLLKRISDDVFETVSGKWKCKDFMNEVVVCYHTGESFSIYGFHTKPSMIDVDMEYLPMLVELSVPHSQFESNVASMNNWLLEQGLDSVDVFDVGTDPELGGSLALVKFPLIVLSNTYLMSVYTLILRCCNEKLWTTFEELLKVTNQQDRGLLNALAKKPPNKFPKELSDYIIYYTPKYNLPYGKKVKDIGLGTGTIHNTGLMGWGNDEETWEEVELPKELACAV